MKIAVVGAGYVGLSNSILLAQQNEVVALDIVPAKVSKLNQREFLIGDTALTLKDYLKDKPLNFRATLDKNEAYVGADYVVIATPTDYDPETTTFNTQSIEAVIRDVMVFAPEALIVIKSTVPIGYTHKIKLVLGTKNVLFSPEFLREDRALFDIFHPSRIVVGEQSLRAQIFADLLKEGAIKRDVPVYLTNSNEAEAIKLFANAYLAMRVAYFNELDTYAAMCRLDTRQIIQGVCLDPRIGEHYNNPSFGYGGYCFPKDTQQLLASYQGIPQSLIQAIVEANSKRKEFIAEAIIQKNPKVVGIYRLLMKAHADNIRATNVEEIVKQLKANRIQVIIYEPILASQEFLDAKVINDLDDFKHEADLIVANRLTHDLADVVDKVYTRDLYGKDE